MARLNELPNELLIQLLALLPQSSLLALSCTDQRLSQVAIQQLYRSLYFWGTGYIGRAAREFPKDFFGNLHETLCPPQNARRIFDLDLLNRSLEESDTLRTLIIELELTWGEGNDEDWATILHRSDIPIVRWTSDGYPANADGSRMHMTSFLDNPRHLVRLDEKRLQHFLSLLDGSSYERLSLITTDLYSQLLEQVGVTSLRLVYRGQECGDSEVLAEDLRRLHHLSCIPTLETLIIDGWRCWGDKMVYASYHDTQNAKTSAISSLQIRTPGSLGDHLNEILSWPKCLKRFHFDCGRGDCSFYALRYYPSSIDFIQPLDQCRATIVELTICCGEKTAGRVTDPPINLQGFRDLKRLRISANFLLMSHYERSIRRKAIEQGNAEPNPDLRDTLPPSIEHLYLEFGFDSRIYYKDWVLPVHKKELLELMDQLEILANSQVHDQLFPHLRYVSLGEAYPWTNSMWTGFDGSERGAQVRAAFANASIGLSFFADGPPPQIVLPP